jgi:UDP-N-acetylglucosamine 4-epimerase
MSSITMAKNDAVRQVYNVTVGVRSTLNELYGMMNALLSGNFAHVAAHAPEYVDFRRGDVRHAQTDISRASTLLEFVPTHRINAGVREAMDCSVHTLPH